MEKNSYAFEERIGSPSLFCGRRQELSLLLNWTDMIPRKLAKSRALLGRRKSGKTAIMHRLFNILWNRNGKVIPFYFEVQQQDRWLLNFSDDYFRTFLSQYLSFKTRTPLPKENKPWKWDILLDMVSQLGNDNIQRVTEDFYDYFEKEDAHNTMTSAFGSPAEFTGYDDVFFVVMIDEIQYMTKHIYRDKDCKILFRNLPGGYHGLSELKYAPMLASGSYIGWMTQMIHELFVGGRLKKTRVSPKLAFEEGMEAVFKYAEHHQIEIKDENALIINAMTQSDPFYIATLFRSDWPERDLSDPRGILRTFAHEILDREGELFGTWSEYIDISLRAVNDIYAKKALLYLSRERHRPCPRNEIMDHLEWPPEKEGELEKKLLALEYGGLITRGPTDYHYKGIEDDVLDLIFRERYQYEIDMVRPDITAELMEKVRLPEDDRKSLEGKFRELKGRLLELIVWRELNRCRKQNRTVGDFAKRMRNIPDSGHADKMREMAELCAKSKFDTVWMNHYLQLPQTTSLEADVFAEGGDDKSCWALIFETKNRDDKYPPTKDEARLLETKTEMTRQMLAQKGREVRFVCPVYFSAKGFEPDVETWLHSRGILTTDLETWEGG